MKISPNVGKLIDAASSLGAGPVLQAIGKIMPGIGQFVPAAYSSGYAEFGDSSGNILVRRADDFYQQNEPFISPDKSVAIRKIREARMDCNSAITHDGKY